MTRRGSLFGLVAGRKRRNSDSPSRGPGIRKCSSRESSFAAVEQSVMQDGFPAGGMTLSASDATPADGAPGEQRRNLRLGADERQSQERRRIGQQPTAS